MYTLSSFNQGSRKLFNDERSATSARLFSSNAPPVLPPRHKSEQTVQHSQQCLNQLTLLEMIVDPAAIIRVLTEHLVIGANKLIY